MSHHISIIFGLLWCFSCHKHDLSPAFTIPYFKSSVSLGITSGPLCHRSDEHVMKKQQQMALVNACDYLLCFCSVYLVCSVNHDWCLAALREANQLSSSMMKSDINRFRLKGFLSHD